MDCDEGEDTDSLLSLSQTFLQPDSSSSSVSLSSNQLHNWPASSGGPAQSIGGHFSPISPEQGYSTSSGHSVRDSKVNFRNYPDIKVSTNPSSLKNGGSLMLNRMSSSGISSNSQNNFSSNESVTSEFSHNTMQSVADASASLCYEQTADPRTNSNDLYGNKTSSRDNTSIYTSEQSVDVGTNMTTTFSHNTDYDAEGMMGLTTASDYAGKLDGGVFDPRAKQPEYAKDLDSLYNQGGNKPLQSSEISMSFDRRDTNTFDNSFEFSSNQKDFASSSRMDVTSLNRSMQDLDYYHPQKYTASQLSGTDTSLNSSLGIGMKRDSSSYTGVGFGINNQGEEIYGRSGVPQRKSGLTHQLNDFPSDLEPVFHGYHTDFDGHHRFPGDIHRNSGVGEFRENEESTRLSVKSQTALRDNSNKWSGRSRAHRKMARLLGSEDHRNYRHTAGPSNSNKPSSFSKVMSSSETVSQTKSLYEQTLSSRDTNTSSKTFFTTEEELDLRTNHHQQRGFVTRRDEQAEKHQGTPKHLVVTQSTSGLAFDTSTMSSSMQKDTMAAFVPSQQFVPSSQFDLDFHTNLPIPQPQKDLDLNQHFGLNVSKDFSMDTTHGNSGQDNLSFEHSEDPQHMNQADLTLTDNLSIGSHVHPDLNLEAYFGPSDRDFGATSERDFSRKLANSVAREISYVPNVTDSDFDIEAYMNAQTHRELNQSYFGRTELPQDMTVYQKPTIEKASVPEALTTFKEQDRNQGTVLEKEKQGEISELQKELTKTSTKESIKGIRIPRDINRAMEILQGLQEDEREEERRKEQQRRQHQLQQQQQQQHPQQTQQQHQNIISSPKKTFQNKHHIESISITDQQFLGGTGSFIEDQTVSSFLDQPHLNLHDQQPDGLHMIQSYQAFSQPQPSAEEDIVPALHSKRDLQQNLTQTMTSDLDYHILKRLALSASIKDSIGASTSSFTNNSNNLACMLTGSSSQEQDVHFPDGTMSNFQTHSNALDDMVSSNMVSQNNQTPLEHNRSKSDINFVDFDTHQPQQQQINNNSAQQTSFMTDERTFRPAVEKQDDTFSSKQEAEVILSSRKNLFAMMKNKQFCDAVISTSNQTVKVHQVVLCSMSQYLTTLLHKMTPPINAASGQTPMSPSSCFTAQTTRNQGVLLVVNCDGIKPSSMSAFLVYVYLGKAELSESNILDLYILSCSLKVTTLKNLCKKYMWEHHISEDQMKIPQLLVSNQRLEMLDKACATEPVPSIVCEDKAVNTGYTVKSMEVATQTDRSTSEAGEGGQEEWVMLKKTKQKTVSPSKSRLIGKSFSGIESPVGFKAGKKGWLSPKRRYKTENQMEMKSAEKDLTNVNKDVSQHPVNTTSSQIVDLPSSISEVDIRKESQLGAHQKNPLYNNQQQTEIEDKNGTKPSPNLKSGQCESSNTVSLDIPGPLLSTDKQQTPSKTTRTTVEIAAAAAAAKVSVHSYGTRAARGSTKHSVSYAALASGHERKRSPANPKDKTVTATSKKKDFIKSNSQTDYSAVSVVSTCSQPDNATSSVVDVSSQKATSLTRDTHITFQNDTTTTVGSPTKVDKTEAKAETFKSSVKRPFKKSIVHRSRSEEVLRNSADQVPSATDGSGVGSEDVSVVSKPTTKPDQPVTGENDFMDTNLIDTIVNTMDCESTDVDLQKVINDLDTLNRSPLLTTVAHTVNLSTALTSPLKSPTTSLSTPESATPVKTKSAPQGFRKRLIHLMNSEKTAALKTPTFTAPESLPVSTSKSVNTTSVTSSVENLNPSSSTTSQEQSCHPSSVKDDQSFSEAFEGTQMASGTDLVMEHPQTDTPQHSNETGPSTSTTEEDVNMVQNSSFSSMTDRALGIKDDNWQHFFHKIFKRKKKQKTRKTVTTDNEGTSIKMKLKKLQASEADGGGTKPRQRKATGSDTEGGGARHKQKKATTNENEGVLAKVRPPPKKRAKMELELLKAADAEESLEKKTGTHIDQDNVVSGQDKENKNKNTESATKTSKEHKGTCGSKRQGKGVAGDKGDDAKQEQKRSVKKRKDTVKKPAKSPKGSKDVADLSKLEVTMETKLTFMLEEHAKSADLKTKQFTCKLCQTKFRSARRTIKHMSCHGLEGSTVLDSIGVGEKMTMREACDICGYRTKDQSYHYMHYHKYFKHGVPLPLGWSPDKCQVCGKECFSKFQLKEHMLVHDDNHRFICWQCGQCFKMRNSLNSHIFHKHSDIRKHKCKVCGKAFKTWTQLKVHVRTHTWERPFCCVDCDHRSTTQGNMKLHLITHGYSKEKIQEMMVKISENIPKVDPETLDQIMIETAEKMKAEQPADKEKKNKEKSNKVTSDDSPGKDVNKASAKLKTSDNRSKKKKDVKKLKESKATKTSKFVGSRIKELFTQPLNKMMPPKFLLPHLQSSRENSHSRNNGSGDKGISQASTEDISITSVGELQQQQQQAEKQDPNSRLFTTTFFIPLSQAEQQQQQLQHQPSKEQSMVDPMSSLMGYTVIPTHLFPGQSVDSAVSMPLFSSSDMLPSGMSMLQSGLHNIQLMQTDNVFTSVAPSSQETIIISDTPNFLGIPQNTEILQDTCPSSLQYPNTVLSAAQTSHEGVSMDQFHSLLATSTTTTHNSGTTMMVLPTVSRSTPQTSKVSLGQDTHTIISYPDFSSANQPLVVPVGPGVQIISSGLDAGNYVNFPIPLSGADDGMALNLPQQTFAVMGPETETSSMEIPVDVSSVEIDVAIDENGSSEPETYVMVRDVETNSTCGTNVVKCASVNEDSTHDVGSMAASADRDRHKADADGSFGPESSTDIASADAEKGEKGSNSVEDLGEIVLVCLSENGN